MNTNIQKSRSFSKGSLLAGAAVAAMAMPAQAIAQDEESGVELEEIIVTATRREQDITETPLAVSVVDRDEALRGGITDISGLADFVPGLVSVDGGGPSLGNLVIRGIYAGGAPTVGTYVDDIPYGGVVGGFASNMALDASLYDLESIEISRGPQGTLFGSGAVGGVVRYVTRKPNLEEIEGYGFIDYSSTKGGDSSQLYRGRISAPIIGGKLAVSASGYFEDAGGYIDSALTADENVNSHEFWGGQLMVKANLSDSISLLGTYAHHEADFASAGYETFDMTTGDPLFGDLVSEFEAPRALEFDMYSFTADIDLGFANLASVTSYQKIELINTTDLTASFGPLADLFAPGGAPHSVSFDSGDASDRFTQEVRLTSQGEGPLQWIAGVYYTKQDSDTFQITDVTPDDIELVTLNNNLVYKETALFGNVSYELSEAWDVTVGFRHSDNQTSIDQMFTGVLSDPLLNDLLTENDDKVTTWMFNTSYHVSDAVNLYARAASGYRPGGSNLVIDFMGMTFGSPSYSPDKLWSYEGGVKGRIGDTGILYDVGVYFIDWNDAQISFTNVLGLGENGNAEGGISAKGIEASLSGEIFEGFVLSSSIAITDSEFKSDEPNLGAMAGEELLQNPSASISLAGDYTFDLSEEVDATVGATFRHSGSYVSNYSQSPLGSWDNEGYSQLDLRAGVSYGNVALNAYVTNLNNNDAYQTVFSAGVPNVGYGVVLRPRTFGANVKVSF